MNKNIETFLGCDSEYDEASIVVFGAPFDGTVSFRPGTRFAPGVMRRESYGLELYSPYLDRHMKDIRVFDAGDLVLPYGSAEKSLQVISEMGKSILDDNKIPCMIGGEHLLTYGLFREVVKKHPDVHIIHFDAHTDLRDEFFGERLSHANVIKLCYDLIGDNKIFQFGIRSGEKEEFLFAKEHTYLHMSNLDTFDEIIDKLKGKNVYFTLDLDVLDPSVLPGTGTPEAGGVSFLEVNKAIGLLKNVNIVGFDINELAPNYDVSGVSTAVACKLLRELLLIVGGK